MDHPVVCVQELIEAVHAHEQSLALQVWQRLHGICVESNYRRP